MKPHHYTPLKLTLLFTFCMLSVPPRATAQDRLSRLEWFIEGGGSFLNLGNQPNEVSIYGSASSGHLVSPDHFSSSELFFTGLRYRLTPTDSLEVSYDMSVWNYFQIQPTAASSAATSSRFERNEWSFNYVRHLPARGIVQPFLTAGAGSIQTATSVTQWHAHDPSINFGVGTDFRINERLALRLEVRDHLGFLPAPLRGASHDLSPTAGLVFSPRTSSSTPTRFPQVEVFLEGGASVLNGGSGTYADAYQQLPNGQLAPYYGVSRTNYFSKAGRFLAGFRVVLSKNNALELSYAESPNRYSMTMVSKSAPPGTVPPLEQVTLSDAPLVASYVRYFHFRASVRPFVVAGAGESHFAGRLEDVNDFGWHAGVGADVPLWNRLVARFEVRDYMSRQPDLTSGIVHNFAPTAGLAYRFK
jgi:hypothetical protein